MITKENIVRHELIGLKTEVVDSRNKSVIGLSGEIIDETQKTFVIETEKGDKKVAKAGSKFRFKKPAVVINGDILVARPEDRIKKKFRRN